MTDVTRGVAVFVLDLDGSSSTIRAVESVIQEAPGGPSIHVHVLMNGTHQEHKARLHSALSGRPAVSLYESPRNLGFTGGNNYLFRVLCSNPPVPEFLLFLNNDAIVESQTIVALLAVLSGRPDAGISGPRILRLGTDRIIADDGAAAIPWLVQQRFRGSGVPDWRVSKGPPRRVPFVSGACMMVKSSVFRQIGGFDESFFAYFEDWDLCMRAARAGHRCWHVPEAAAWHSTGDREGKRLLISHFLMTRNRVLMARKHLPPAVRFLVFLPYFVFVRVVYKVLQQAIMREFDAARGVLLGMIWLLAPADAKRRLWPIKNSNLPGPGG